MTGYNPVDTLADLELREPTVPQNSAPTEFPTPEEGDGGVIF